MTAKKYLEQWHGLKKMIDVKLEQIETLKSLAEKVTATYGEFSEITGNVGRIENAVAKIVDIESEIELEIEKMRAVRLEIAETIGKTEPNYRALLEMRYINNMRWEEIAGRLNCDLRWTYRLHKKALENVQKIVDNFGK